MKGIHIKIGSLYETDSHGIVRILESFRFETCGGRKIMTGWHVESVDTHQVKTFLHPKVFVRERKLKRA